MVVYVVRRRWHIDIGFAAGDLSPPLASLSSRLPGARYLVFGFGDGQFLMNKDQASRRSSPRCGPERVWCCSRA
jgi:hypothetical protein